MRPLPRTQHALPMEAPAANGHAPAVAVANAGVAADAAARLGGVGLVSSAENGMLSD